jgi:short-subunit dehydrogenase
MRIDFAAGMAPEAVARGILRALQRNRNETVLGREARMILYLNRFMPRLVDRLMTRKVKQLYADEME